MEKVKTPSLTVTYDGKDISADISEYLISLTYTDVTEGESDELTLELENQDGRWLNAWFPDKGSLLSAQIGLGENLMNCGSFEIDEIEVNGPPDTITIKALASGIKQAVRTEKSTAFENQTLSQIANTIASRNGFTVQGTIENIQFERITQNRESDLAFLRRISAEFGYLFSVRNKTLVFTTMYDLEQTGSVLTVDRSEVTSYNLKDKTSFVFQQATVKHHSPTLKELVEANSEKDSGVVKTDVLQLRSRAENKQQAELKAKAAMYRTNRKQQTGNFSREGNPLMVAGNNIDLTGFGQISGKYHIEKSTHTITGTSGYSTNVDVKRVGFIEETKESKPKTTKPGLAELVDDNTDDE